MNSSSNKVAQFSVLNEQFYDVVTRRFVPSVSW